MIGSFISQRLAGVTALIQEGAAISLEHLREIKISNSKKLKEVEACAKSSFIASGTDF
jgi:hypothetical protein